MYNDREIQIVENITKEFLKNKGRVPTKIELLDKLRHTNIWSPFTKPRVPLKNATSNAEYVTHTLRGLLLDSNSVNDMIVNLIKKLGRVSKTSRAELRFLQNKAAKLLEIYETTNYVTSIYNEKPGIPEKDSYNIDYDKSGIKVLPSSQAKLTYVQNIEGYSLDGSNVALQTVNTENPLTILVNGSSDTAKGISLQFTITDADNYVSAIHIECDPITIEVLVNGESLVVKEVIDNSETFIIGRKVNSLEIRAYSDTPQVMITIQTIELLKSEYGSGQGYDTGVYISPAIDLGNENGRTIFTPSVYIPEDGGVVWYYSTDYGVSGPSADWNLIEKDKDDIMHLWWNYQGVTGTIGNVPLVTSNSLITISQLDDTPQDTILAYNGLKVKAGKNCILFIADTANEIYKYNTFVVVGEEGFLLEILNPTAGELGKLVKHFSVKSDTFSHNEGTSSTDVISVDLPEGTHKVVFELNNDPKFLEMKTVEGEFDFKGIINKISTKFGVEFDPRLAFTKDYLGREVSLYIQPNTLELEDYTVLPYIRPLERINKMAVQPSTRLQVENWATSPNLYSVIPSDTSYTTEVAYFAHKEIQYYAGPAVANWYFYGATAGDVIFHEPSLDFYANDVGYGVAVFNGETGGNCYGDGVAPDDYNNYTPFGCSGIDSSHGYWMKVLDTTDTTADNINYIGQDYVSLFTLENSSKPGTSGTFSGASYDRYDIFSCSTCVQGSTFALEREPDIAPTYVTAINGGATVDVSYEAPTGAGEDGGIITFSDHTVTNVDYIVSYSATPKVRQHEPATPYVFIENLPKFPEGATAAEFFEVLNSVTDPGGATSEIVSATGATYGVLAENFVTQYVVSSIHSLEYKDVNTGATVSLGGWTADEPGATGGHLLEYNGYSLTIDTQDLVLNQTLFLTYNTYNLSTGYSFDYSYSYYKDVPYHFSYHHKQAEDASTETIYGSTGMLNHFYDISYYTAKDATEEIYIKAVMQGSSLETPIIRRLRFNNEQ